MRGDALQSELEIALADELNIASVSGPGRGVRPGYGDMARRYNRSDVGRALRASMAEGVTLFDTAEMYANGAWRGSSARYCARVVSRGRRS